MGVFLLVFSFNINIFWEKKRIFDSLNNMKPIKQKQKLLFIIKILSLVHFTSVFLKKAPSALNCEWKKSCFFSILNFFVSFNWDVYIDVEREKTKLGMILNNDSGVYQAWYTLLNKHHQYVWLVGCSNA